jgi:hypothetical protein
VPLLPLILINKINNLRIINNREWFKSTPRNQIHTFAKAEFVPVAHPASTRVDNALTLGIFTDEINH